MTPYIQKYVLEEIERILKSGRSVEEAIRPVFIYTAPDGVVECLGTSGNKWTATFEQIEAFRVARMTLSELEHHMAEKKASADNQSLSERGK